jgi:predicted cobalt transporter CbtA
MQPPLPGDKVAGYVGMVAGFVMILVTVFVITRLTSRSFESHAAAPHGPPPAGAPAPPASGAGTPAPAPR